MLITVYEEDNSAYFKAKFTTPLTLPKNAEISLLKAYIPRDHNITIDDTNNQLYLQAHSDDPACKTLIQLVNGKYGVGALAVHIQGVINAIQATTEANNLGQLRNLGVYVSATIRDNSVGNETFKFFIRPRTISPSFYYEMNFDSVGNKISGANFEEVKSVAGDTYTIVKTANNLRCSVYDNAGAKKGWDNVCVIQRGLDRQRFAPSPHVNIVKSLPSYNETHTLINWKIGDITAGGGNSFWVGVKQGGSVVDVSGCAVGDLSQISNIGGLVSCLAVYGETANGKNANSVEAFEDVGGTMTSLGALSNNALEGEELIILIPHNASTMSHNEYYIKKLNGIILRINYANAHRYIPLPNQVFNICCGFYNGSGAEDTILNLRSGMDAGYMNAPNDTTKGVGLFESFGKYIEIYLSGANNDNKTLGEDLGFQHEEYDEDSSVGAVVGSALNITNEDDMETNDQKQPYINLNITNLPVNSMSCSQSNSSDIAVGETQHNYSRCVASLPRYNLDDGGFDNLAIVFDDNTQSIKLNNNNEIILSSLDFRLQNCDGSYPTDLLTPSSFVFKVDGVV